MRFISSLIMLLSILYLPWWATLLMMVSFSFVFNSYIEGMLWGFVADSLYAPQALFANGFALQYFFTFSIVILLIELLKKRLKFYS